MSPVATAQRPVGSPVRARLAETDVLTVHPDDPLTVDRLLRRLEVLRKRLSVRWCGDEGAFAGYDRLTIEDLSGIVDGAVVLNARLVDTQETSHTVELVATRSIAPVAEEHVLVRGTGRALQTRTAARP